MIITPIALLADYAAINERLKVLADYLNAPDFVAPTEQTFLMGDELFINAPQLSLRPIAPALEVHEQYIDVHIPITAAETYGWTSLIELHALGIKSEDDFNTTDDFALYAAPPKLLFTLHPGECCIFFPDDAHAPTIGHGPLHKLIAKVKI